MLATATSAEYSLHSVPLSEVLGATAVPGRYGDKTMAGNAGGSDDGEVRDPGGPKHADADRGRGYLTGHEPAPVCEHAEMNTTLHDRIHQVNRLTSLKNPSF